MTTQLYIDMAYSLAELRQRKHDQFYEARHSGGYFERVIGLHPLADRVTTLDRPIECRKFSDRQDVIEAKSAALGLPRWLFPLDFVLTQRKLLSYVSDVVRKENVGIISATDPLYSGLFGFWVKRRTGLPLIIHVVANYDLNYESTGSLAMPRLIPFRTLEKALIRYVLKRADLIAAGSATIHDYSIAEGAPAELTDLFRVSKNIVPAHRGLPRERRPLEDYERESLGIGRSQNVLLTVARLEPVKMIEDSIRAFAVVAKQHPDTILVLAGDGSDRERLEAISRELGVADRVRFAGLLDQELLARLMPSCVVLSPLTGIALFETSMAGCPTIAYDCDSAVSEMVETGVTGILIPAGDWQAMGDAASELLADRSERDRYSKAIRARAEDLCDETKLYAHEHRAYDRMLKRDSVDRE